MGPGTTPAPGQVVTPYQTAATNVAVDQYINTNNTRTAGNFIDNILNFNKGKLAKVHMTFNSGGASSVQKVFTGIIETTGRDHIILSDPKTGHRYVLLSIYLDYVEFPEEINYYYPGTNTLNIADEDFLKNNPEIMPLYNFKKHKQDMFIAQVQQSTPNSVEMITPGTGK
jgi:spore germination protein Q